MTNKLENHPHKLHFDELVKRLDLSGKQEKRLTDWFLNTGAMEYARLKTVHGFNYEAVMNELTEQAKKFLEG